jgi:aldehyde dehydrogenase (NAD+)
VSNFHAAIERVKSEGGKIIYGGESLSGEEYESGCYVTPVCPRSKRICPLCCEEHLRTPATYLMKYKTIEEAIALHNDEPQGLSTAIFNP